MTLSGNTYIYTVHVRAAERTELARLIYPTLCYKRVHIPLK